MPTRQTLAATWLMTDRRLGDAVWSAIKHIPHGGGVVLRHHASDLILGGKIARVCQRRGLMLAVAGDVGFAQAIGAAMVHNPVGSAGDLLVSWSVHDLAEAETARSADLIFVSPLFATASHPGTAALGIEHALKLAELAGVPAIALGGMNVERGSAAVRAGFYGWAAIDAWLTTPA